MVICVHFLAMDGAPEAVREFKEKLKICIMRDISHQSFVDDRLVRCLNSLDYSEVKICTGTETTGVSFNDYEAWILLPPISSAYRYINRLESIVKLLHKKKKKNCPLISVITFQGLDHELDALKDSDIRIQYISDIANFQTQLENSEGMQMQPVYNQDNLFVV